MRRRLIEALEDAIAAERLAEALRETHGASAEAVCDQLISARAVKDREWLRLNDVRRALGAYRLASPAA